MKKLEGVASLTLATLAIWPEFGYYITQIPWGTFITTALRKLSEFYKILINALLKQLYKFSFLSQTCPS